MAFLGRRNCHCLYLRGVRLLVVVAVAVAPASGTAPPMDTSRLYRDGGA